MKYVIICCLIFTCIVACSTRENVKDTVITTQNISKIQNSVQNARDLTKEEQQWFMLGQIQLGQKVLGKTVADVVAVGKTK